jgi:hypothetical protein
MGWHKPQKVQLDLGVPKLDGLDRFALWFKARTDKADRAQARKAAAGQKLAVAEQSMSDG